MAKTSSPFGDFDPSKLFDPAKMMEFPKMMGEMKLNGVDMEAVITSQRRNLEALAAANQLAVDGMQAFATRQAEILRQTMEETSSALREMMSAGDTEDKAAKQTELAKAAFERAIANMRELAEMVATSNGRAIDVINRRVAESLDEVKSMIAQRREK
ncbi:MAG: phasin family protein [Rhodospirillales bacterium]|nr:phasin family protein [Rhodospirillales bacterium]